MTSLDSLGLLNKTYVYGFDEMPEIYNESVYEIFGDLKKKWPSLTTMVSYIDGRVMTVIYDGRSCSPWPRYDCHLRWHAAPHWRLFQ
eukprot:COSAG02_NODE_1320_length_13269_cov_11.420058_9_plen_87_part_00